MTSAGLTAKRGGPLRGRVRAPGDKSISHRSLILGALARGTTEIEGLLEGDDVLRTAQAMRSFVDNVEKNGVEQLKSEGMEVVTNVDRKSFEEAVAPVYPEYAKKFGKELLDASLFHDCT